MNTNVYLDFALDRIHKTHQRQIDGAQETRANDVAKGRTGLVHRADSVLDELQQQRTALMVAEIDAAIFTGECGIRQLAEIVHKFPYLDGLFDGRL